MSQRHDGTMVVLENSHSNATKLYLKAKRELPDTLVLIPVKRAVPLAANLLYFKTPKCLF